MTKKQLCQIHPWHLFWRWDWNQPGQQVVLLHLCSCWTVACQAHKRSDSNVFDVALQVTLKRSANTGKAFRRLTLSLIGISDWFPPCATCFFFVWSHYLTLCLNMFEKHIFHQCTSLLFFFKPITSVQKIKKTLKKRSNWSGNELYPWFWKGKYIAAVTSSDASFVLWSTNMVTSVLSVLHCLVVLVSFWSVKEQKWS